VQIPLSHNCLIISLLLTVQHFVCIFQLLCPRLLSRWQSFIVSTDFLTASWFGTCRGLWTPLSLTFWFQLPISGRRVFCFRTSHHCTLDPVIYGLRMRELRECWRHLAAMIRSPVDGRLWLGRRRRHAINHDITQLSNLIMSINHYHLQNTSFAQRSQWSSSSIYSTIPSRESVSDSWYLFTARRYAAVSGCPLHLSVICNQSVRHKLMFSHNGGTYLCATNFTAFIDSTLWDKKNKTTNSCP